MRSAALDAIHRAMAGGISPRTLLAQVKNTAAWALVSDRAEGPAHWRSRLARADALEELWRSPHTPELREEYFAMLLAAHHATVGTFVPTDVDTRIRFHHWQEISQREVLVRAVALVDEAAQWDPREVSARTVDLGEAGTLSGHDGEWFAVRAGALGRALQLRADDAVETLTGAIDAELEREANAMRSALQAADAVRSLAVATTLAHNLGDLSRVVDDWPAKGARADELRAKYTRLGHADVSRYGGAFALAGALNKAVMATENHRYLPLRNARGLRKHRGLLLPFGPWLEAWGKTVARHPSLDRRDRGEVLSALVEGHEGDASQQSWARAIAGLHEAHPGGVEALANEVPARSRKLLATGAIREALRVSPEHYAARVEKRMKAALASFGETEPGGRAVLAALRERPAK